MMIKFINAQTGSLMYVAPERVDEYIKAGHKPYAPPTPAPVPKVETKKTRAKGKPKQGV